MPEIVTNTKRVTPLEIIAAMDAAAQLANLALGWANALRERGEWSPEQEAAFDAKIAALPGKPHWQLSNQSRPYNVK